MTDTQLRNYLFFRDKKAALKAQIKEIKDQALPLEKQLSDLEDKETELETRLIEAFEEEGVKTKIFEGHSIISQAKTYTKIVDPDKVMETLSSKYIAPLKRIIGKSYEELRVSLVKPAELDTKKAKEYIDILQKVENVSEIEGTEIQTTKYLTVK